jgi:hypothetical protein
MARSRTVAVDGVREWLDDTIETWSAKRHAATDGPETHAYARGCVAALESVRVLICGGTQ